MLLSPHLLPSNCPPATTTAQDAPRPATLRLPAAAAPYGRCDSFHLLMEAGERVSCAAWLHFAHVRRPHCGRQRQRVLEEPVQFFQDDCYPRPHRSWRARAWWGARAKSVRSKSMLTLRRRVRLPKATPCGGYGWALDYAGNCPGRTWAVCLQDSELGNCYFLQAKDDCTCKRPRRSWSMLTTFASSLASQASGPAPSRRRRLPTTSRPG